ncbi:hypothetical protein HYH02_013826 [Chlamydomonas schloesseri]|uniref:Cysteine-rich DPF motif domain-containing protein 1 n=1 Tax=Chlamydomonas schloesseri TaxID=2026947 RepID=A0A835SMW1_9CHLO|nr:hypothetical protein HYH02_013826 [Chlamydomonas schloesseri]|eukprot:KAG2429998.1 hypothetical protein HYH02_013826 [Chlamydomonas schloesseri]
MHSDANGACRVAFLEQGWLAVDPFSVKARPLMLGSPCSLCQRPVCVADSCSVFYAKRFCLHCARANAAAFPPAVHKAAPAIFGGGAGAGAAAAAAAGGPSAGAGAGGANAASAGAGGAGAGAGGGSGAPRASGPGARGS